MFWTTGGVHNQKNNPTGKHIMNIGRHGQGSVDDNGRILVFADGQQVGKISIKAATAYPIDSLRYE